MMHFRDPTGVVHLKSPSTLHPETVFRETLCEHASQSTSWASGMLDFTDEVPTCIACLGARTS